MAYLTQAQIETLIAPAHLNDALDDDGDGQPDTGLLAAIIAQADSAVDGYLAGLFTVPFVTVPAIVAQASLIFAAEMIYARRISPSEKNPFTPRADAWRDRLQLIGSGKLPLDAAVVKPNPPGASVTEDVEVDESLR
jgi:phage gp36-like protein